MPDLDDLEKWRAEARYCTEMAEGAEPPDAGCAGVAKYDRGF
jgi:hypothetical protein